MRKFSSRMESVKARFDKRKVSDAWSYVQSIDITFLPHIVLYKSLQERYWCEKGYVKKYFKWFTEQKV